MNDTALPRWIASLEERHLADLTFQEVARALRALSSTYVERRGRLPQGAALSGAGKRAAFALFYGPLHFMLVEKIVAQLPGACSPHAGSPSLLVDLGCGTGAAGAAWAAAAGIHRVLGIDRNPWALGEAGRTYRAFGLTAKTRQGDVARTPFPMERTCLLAAFTMNELPDDARDSLMRRLMERAIGRGDRLLVVEPIARSAAPWWSGWQRQIEAAGGRADEWRFRVDVPPIVARLDRAAGLDHRELTGRTLWLSTAAGDPGSSN